MINPFNIGDEKTFSHNVGEGDLAAFSNGEVHRVYSTFALGRDAEWACRLFVLDMKESHEEGIGTFLSVQHESPALVGSEVLFTATLTSVNKNEVVCSYEVRVGDRKIAHGEQKQKIVKKEKLKVLFSSIV